MPETFVMEFFLIKLQVKGNSEALGLLGPTFVQLPLHLTIVTAILKVMETPMFQVTDMTLRFPY